MPSLAPAVPVDLDALILRHTPTPVPKCSVCSRDLTKQAWGAGEQTVWGCSKGFNTKTVGADRRSHYLRSRWVQPRAGDPDLLDALLELRRLRALVGHPLFSLTSTVGG